MVIASIPAVTQLYLAVVENGKHSKLFVGLEFVPIKEVYSQKNFKVLWPAESSSNKFIEVIKTGSQQSIIVSLAFVLLSLIIFSWLVEGSYKHRQSAFDTITIGDDSGFLQNFQYTQGVWCFHYELYLDNSVSFIAVYCSMILENDI